MSSIAISGIAIARAVTLASRVARLSAALPSTSAARPSLVRSVPAIWIVLKRYVAVPLVNETSSSEIVSAPEGGGAAVSARAGRDEVRRKAEPRGKGQAQPADREAAVADPFGHELTGERAHVPPPDAQTGMRREKCRDVALRARIQHRLRADETETKPCCAEPERGARHGALNGEARTAAAGCGGLRIVDLEGAAHQVVDEVDARAAQIFEGGLIDQHGRAVTLEDEVVRFPRGDDVVGVLEAGAAARRRRRRAARNRAIRLPGSRRRAWRRTP